MCTCPVCQTEFTEGEIRKKCPVCDWDLTPDPPTMGQVPEPFRQKIQRTLEWAKNSWTKRQELQSQVSQLQKQLEREQTSAQTQLAEMQAQLAQAKQDESDLQAQQEQFPSHQPLNSGKAKVFREALGEGIYLEMVLIPGGTFLMGSPETEAEGHEHESPQHEVRVASFWIGKVAVTQKQWQAVANFPQISQALKRDTSEFKGRNRPVEQVSWYDTVEFCARLSRRTGREYRLPSEAEWEFACRAGKKTPFNFGETINPDLANYLTDPDSKLTDSRTLSRQCRNQTTPVGSFQENAFGLYDLHGNVCEWCADIWHENYHDAPCDGSVWKLNGDDKYRVLRGGSWHEFPKNCRCASRLKARPGDRRNDVGFRIVLSSSSF